MNMQGTTSDQSKGLQIQKTVNRLVYWVAALFSLFCLGTDACVSLEGLKYNLEKGTLSSSFPLGVSNHFTGSAARVTVHSGTVVAMYSIDAGFPEGG